MHQSAALVLLGALVIIAGVAWYASPGAPAAAPPAPPAPAPAPERQVVVGFWECLPKVGPGPHTLECALGIALEASDGHLAVDTNLMALYPVDFPTGTKVRIEGVVTPATHLSSDRWQSYDIDGIISATTIEKVE